MSDKEQIENCIDIYYAGCCESDSNKIKEAFDNNARISGYLPDGLHEKNLDEVSEFVSYLFSLFSPFIIYFTGLENSIMLSESIIAFDEYKMIFWFGTPM